MQVLCIQDVNHFYVVTCCVKRLDPPCDILTDFLEKRMHLQTPWEVWLFTYMYLYSQKIWQKISFCGLAIGDSVVIV